MGHSGDEDYVHKTGVRADLDELGLDYVELLEGVGVLRVLDVSDQVEHFVWGYFACGAVKGARDWIDCRSRVVHLEGKDCSNMDKG